MKYHSHNPFFSPYVTARVFPVSHRDSFCFVLCCCFFVVLCCILFAHSYLQHLVEEGGDVDEALPLTSRCTLVGRAALCDLIVRHESISRQVIFTPTPPTPPSTHPSPHSSQSTPSLHKHTLHINSTQPHPHPTISARRVPPRGRPLIDSSFFNQLINSRPTISARRVPPRRRREFRPRPRIVGRYLLRRLTVAFQPADEAHRRLRAQVRRVRDHVHLPPAQRAGRRREETEEGEWRAPD